MSIVTITINNKNFKLSCNDGSEELLLSLAANVDSKMSQLKNANTSASFELLLVLNALSLEEEIQNLNNKLDKLSDKNARNEQEQFSETLSNIAVYLETLAQKLGK